MEYVISKKCDLVVDSFFYLEPVSGLEYRGKDFDHIISSVVICKSQPTGIQYLFD